MKTFGILGCCAVAAMMCGCGQGPSAEQVKPSAEAVMLSAELKGEAERFAMKGQKLFVGITQCNTEREAAGLSSVWPKSRENTSVDAEDVAGIDFVSSAKWFEELFNIKKYGKKDWSPYISGVSLGVLSGSGVPAYEGANSLDGKYVGWCVLKGVQDEMEDVIPVLVSANVNVADLPVSGTFQGKSDKLVRLGTANGASKDMFGNQFFVVVRKGGAAQVYDAKTGTLAAVYNKQGFTVPAGAKLEYIKP